MNPNRNLFKVASLTLLTAGSVPAAVFVTNPNGTWSDGGSIVTVATPFKVGATPLSISALGIFDQDADGLEHLEEVGIFSLDKTLLGSVTIKYGTASPFHDGSRWENLSTPIALEANTSYLLAWSVRPGGVQINVATPTEVTVNPLFALDSQGYHYTQTGVPGLNFPDLEQRTIGLYAFGGNMELVPEPTAGLVVAAGLLGFAAWRRGRSRV